jgi:rhomboid protease GluP
MIRILSTLLSRPPRPNAAIVGALSVGFIAVGTSLYWKGAMNAQDWMPASYESVFKQHQFWRLFTTLIAHSDIGHLAANSFLFAILSFLLYGYFGTIVYPLMTWGLAIPMTAIALWTYGDETDLVGASGIVYLMGGLWLSLYFFLARNKTLTQRLLRSVGVMLGVFFPTSFEQHISYRVHFIGLGIGLAAGLIYYFANRNRLRAAEVVGFDEDDESPIEFNNLDELENLPPPEFEN